MLWDTHIHSNFSHDGKASLETMVNAAKANEKIQKLMEGMEVVRTIAVRNKLVNLILKPAK